MSAPLRDSEWLRPAIRRWKARARSLGPRLRYSGRAYARLADDLRGALAACRDEIPVLVVSYNNGVYVRNMVSQLRRFGVTPIVVDNRSTEERSIACLRELRDTGAAQVVWSGKNCGHKVGFIEPVYPLLPEVFAYTDPDLQLNPGLPADFLQVLAGLTTRYRCYKAGFALEFPEGERVVEHRITISARKLVPYLGVLDVKEFESRFWRFPLVHEELEVYAAQVDTTFAVYRKSNFRGELADGVRVSGRFGAIHLPWFPGLDLFTEEDRAAYARGNVSSRWVGRS